MNTFNIKKDVKTPYLRVLESLVEQSNSLKATHNPQTWRLSALTFALHLHDCYVLFANLKERWGKCLPFSEAWDVNLKEWKNDIWNISNNVISFTTDDSYSSWVTLCEKDYNTFIEITKDCLNGELPIQDLLDFLKDKNTELEKVILDCGKTLSTLLKDIEEMLHNSSSELFENFFDNMMQIYMKENADYLYVIENNGELLDYEDWKASKTRKKLPSLLKSKVESTYKNINEIKFWQETWEECFNIEDHAIDKEGFGRFIFVNRKKIIESKTYPCRNCLDKCFSALALCQHLWDEEALLLSPEENFEEVEKMVRKEIHNLEKHVKPSYVEKYHLFWKQVFSNKEVMRKMQVITPNGFTGKHNKKLVCNIIGLLNSHDFYDIKNHQINTLIYGEQTCYTYINNIRPGDDNRDCEMTKSMMKKLEEFLK